MALGARHMLLDKVRLSFLLFYFIFIVLFYFYFYALLTLHPNQFLQPLLLLASLLPYFHSSLQGKKKKSSPPRDIN